MARCSSGLEALRAAGRLRVTRHTGPCSSSRTTGLKGFSTRLSLASGKGMKTGNGTVGEQSPADPGLKMVGRAVEPVQHVDAPDTGGEVVLRGEADGPG